MKLFLLILLLTLPTPLSSAAWMSAEDWADIVVELGVEVDFSCYMQAEVLDGMPEFVVGWEYLRNRGCCYGKL